MFRWHAKDEARDEIGIGIVIRIVIRAKTVTGSQLHATHRTHHQTILTDPGVEQNRAERCVESENQLRGAFHPTFDLVSRNFN